MANKNNGNGYTVKEMLSRTLDKIDKNDEKRSSDIKRLYDAQKEAIEEIMKYNYAQDKVVKDLSEEVTKIDTKLGIIWKGLTGAIAIITTAVVGLFLKK